MRIRIIFYLLFYSITANSSDLITIYQQAADNDPTVRSARFKSKLGEAQAASAGGQLLPQITATANLSLNDRYTTGAGMDGYKGEQYNFNVNQSLIDVPKYLNWRRTQKVFSQYNLEEALAEQSLMLDVVEKYFGVLNTQDSVFLNKQEIISTRQQLAQLKKQFEKRIVRITDVMGIEAKLSSLEADLIDAEMNHVIAKDELKQLTGQAVNLNKHLREDIIFKPIEGAIELWVEAAKIQSRMIQVKSQQVEAAHLYVDEKKSKHLPVVDMKWSYVKSNTGFQSSQQPNTETQVAAINITMPLFNGGSTMSGVDEATQQLEISKQESIATTREVLRETKAAFLKTNASVGRIAATQKSLNAALKAKNAMEKGFKYGVQTITDVLLAQAHVYKARKDLLEAKYSYINHKIKFLFMVGLVAEDHLNEVNGWLETNQVLQRDNG